MLSHDFLPTSLFLTIIFLLFMFIYSFKSSLKNTKKRESANIKKRRDLFGVDQLMYIFTTKSQKNKTIFFSISLFLYSVIG